MQKDDHFIKMNTQNFLTSPSILDFFNHSFSNLEKDVEHIEWKKKQDWFEFMPQPKEE